jgi:hypothetical protein
MSFGGQWHAVLFKVLESDNLLILPIQIPSIAFVCMFKTIKEMCISIEESMVRKTV